MSGTSLPARGALRRLPRVLSRISRAVATGVLGLQGLLWIGGPIADGTLEASSARTITHIEELGGTKCERVHSHMDCLICRSLDLNAAPAPSELALGRTEPASTRFERTAAEHAADASPGGHGSRAPPAAATGARHA